MPRKLVDDFYIVATAANVCSCKHKRAVDAEREVDGNSLNVLYSNFARQLRTPSGMCPG